MLTLARHRGDIRLSLTAIALAAASVAASAAPTAGTVAFSRGDVAIRTAQGASRPATTGSPIETGETIETRSGRAQLRMIDGAYISLQPETELTFDTYQLGTAATPESGFMNLVRGGMRTITGLIGRTQRSNYKLTTPTATIGIRGTEYSVVAKKDGSGQAPTGPGNSKGIATGTTIKVVDGLVLVCSTTCVTVAAGEGAYVPSITVSPKKTAQSPSLPPEPAPETTVTEEKSGKKPYQAAEERGPQGTSETVIVATPVVPPSTPTPPPSPLPDGAGTVGIVYATTGAGPSGASILNTTNTYDSSGALINYTTTPANNYGSNPIVAESSHDGIIAWGRWTFGNGNFSGTAGTIHSLHYYATTNTQVAAIPVIQAYAAFASTAPVLTSSSGGGILATGVSNSVTGSININFAGATGGSATFALQVPFEGQVFSLSGTASQANTLSFAGSGTITSTGTGCASTCYGALPSYGLVQGSVTGAGNSRVGANYSFTSQELGAAYGAMYGGNLSGAVVFK